jgi:hypothetical protein
MSTLPPAIPQIPGFDAATAAPPSTSRGEPLPPRTDDELHAWVHRHLGLSVARRAPCRPEGAGLPRSAPFDYLRHTFFENAATPQDCIVWAARGTGKTMLGAVATALDLVFKPGIQVRILAGSFEQGQRMHEYLRALFERPALAPLLRSRITEKRLVLRSGSRVEILAQSQPSVRGTRIQKLRCDEVELFDDDVWEAAQLTTRSMPYQGGVARGAVECLSTMHLAHGPMSRLLKEAAAGTRTLFRWNVIDTLAPCPPARSCGSCALLPECAGAAKVAAPGGHITVEDGLAQKSRVSLPQWEAEMLCLRASRSHAVLPEFDAATHTFPGDPPAGALVCGIDFGFRAPVILWARLDGERRVWVFDERTTANTTLDRHIDAILAHPAGRPRWTGVDPAGAGLNEHSGISSIDKLARAGLRPRWRQAGIAAGLDLLRARLRPADGSAPRLFIHRRCTALIEALERYHYDPKDPARDAPVKDGPDHAVDALRYLLVNLDTARDPAQSRYI